MRNLLVEGASVNAIDEHGISPLHIAARKGDVIIVEALLVGGADTSPSEYHKSIQPLHHAAQNGHVEVVNLLLDWRAPVDASTFDGGTPLILASGRGHITVVDRLLKASASVSSFYEETGQQAIHCAAQAGHHKIVKRLLVNANQPADVNAEEFDGTTPLHIVASNGDFPTFQLLLHFGARIDAMTHGEHVTPALAAVYQGNMQILRLLHQQGANMDAKLVNGWTPLYLAASYGNPTVLEFLLDQCVNVDVDPISSDLNKSALYLAIDHGHETCAEILIAHGANVHHVAKDGTTPIFRALVKCMPNLVSRLLKFQVNLDFPQSHPPCSAIHLAAKSGSATIMSDIIAVSVDLDSATEDGATPLHLAAQRGYSYIVEMLLTAGADANKSSYSLRHPIHQAAEHGRIEVVKRLLLHITNIDVKDEGGRTPLWLAAKNGHKDVVSILIAHHANVMEAERGTEYLPIHLAASGNHLAVLDLLARAGGDVDRPAKDGTTPLWHAVFNGSNEAAEFLLQYPVNVNATETETGRCILHHVCAYCDLHVYNRIMQFEPNLDQRDFADATPLWFATRRDWVEMVKSLLLSGAGAESRETRDGLMATHLAAAQGNLGMVKMFSWSPSPENGHRDSRDTVTNKGKTSLFLAAENGHADVVRFLLEEHEAPVDTETIGGRRQAIHQAAEHGHKDVIDLSIEYGANPDAIAADGVTPLWLAAQNGHNEIVTLLRTKKAMVNARVRLPIKSLSATDGGREDDSTDEED